MSSDTPYKDSLIVFVSSIRDSIEHFQKDGEAQAKAGEYATAHKRNVQARTLIDALNHLWLALQDEGLDLPRHRRG